MIFERRPPSVRGDTSQEGTGPDSGPADEQAVRPGRFGLLLLVLVSSYLVSALTRGRFIEGLQVVLFTGVALLALRNSSMPRLTVRLIMVAVLAGSAIMLALSVTSTTGAGIADIWAGLILLFATAAIVYRVLSLGTVTLQSIYGALSAYMIIGLMFAAFFAAINHLGGGHFFANGEPANTQTFQYFSFTTLTTLGYGDFTAAGSGGRAFAVLEALTGQVFLATLVARLVAAFRASGERRR
jgi:hypothetical protein